MTENPDVLVRARSLVKRFGEFTAVDGIDIDVHTGEAFGILGPNGAGKTSAMKMIAATSPVTEGSLTIFGLDPAADGPAIRARLGVVSQMDNLDTEVSVADNLRMYARYFGMKRSVIEPKVNELLEFAQLVERRDSKVDPLSGGMRRRLVIARALLNSPDLLLLDEPTTGLDPQARHLLWERLWSLKRSGTTLLITTHYMDEAEQLCDRLVVMDHGKIVDEGSPRSLIERHCTREVVEARFDDHGQLDLAAAQLGTSSARIERLADRLLLYVDNADDAMEALHREGMATPTTTLIRRSTLEDVFLTLTGRALTEL